MKKPEISLCLIVKPSDDEADFLNKCLASVAPHVDEICVTITGENKKADEVCRNYNAKVSHFKWVDDFAKAREFNFKQATGEWVLWLDADDVLEGADNLRKLKWTAEENSVDGYAFEYQYAFDENGRCRDVHWKLQFLRNDGHAEWRGAIHEDLAQKRAVHWVRGTGVIRRHTGTDARSADANERNLRILLKEVKKNPEEPRNYFYLGRSYQIEGDHKKTIEVLEKYLELSGWDEERYEAHILIGQALRLNKQYDDALRVYSAATMEREDYPDAYIQKGMTYMSMNEYGKAVYNFRIATGQDIPSGQTYFNPNLYTRDLYGSLAYCYLQLSKLDEAKRCVGVARKVDRLDKHLKELEGIIDFVTRQKNVAKSYLEITQYLKSAKKERLILPLISSVPTEFSDNQVISKIKNDHFPPEKWPQKSIAVYALTSAEPWDGNNLNQGGIGGSETAIIEISRRLVRMGWDVTVFNHREAPPEGVVVDGVTYKNYWLFNERDEFDVLWVWRAPEAFDWKLKARVKILDLHDVMNPLDFTKKRVENIDKIFVKTNYHRSLLPNISDEKFVVVGNGISLENFEGVVEKEKNRCVYSSTPDRGLDILLEYIWPTVKKAVPDATLHCYYGWKTFHAFQKHNPERMKWMKKVQKLAKQDGVVWHDRVGQKELHKELQKTEFWLYPTYFPEIFCITACESQAAGVIPITSGYAALEETQQSGIKIEGDVYDPSWQEEYAQKVISSMNGRKWVENESKKAVEASKQFDWDIVASKWDKELRSEKQA